MGMLMSDKEFNTAKAKPGYRYGYVSTFDLEDKARFVQGAYYINEQSSGREAMYTKANPINLQEFKEKGTMTSEHQATIWAFAGAFVSQIPIFNVAIQCEADFASSLVDHEGKHAQQWYENPNSLVTPEKSLYETCPDIVYALRLHADSAKSSFALTPAQRVDSIVKNWDRAEIEAEAFNNQMEAVLSGKRQVSDTFRKFLLADAEYYKGLIAFKKGEINAKELFKKLSSLACYPF
jgi:hypothetical protein